MNQMKKNETETTHTPKRLWIILLLLVQQSLDGLVYPIAKYGLSHIDPFAFAFFRFIISSAVLLGIVRIWYTPDPPIEKKDYLKIIGLGIIAVIFNQAAFLFGQKLTGAGHGSLMFATAPIWLFLGGLIFMKEKFILRRAIGVILGLTGVAVIITSGAIELGTRYLFGDFIILEAVISWVVYTIFCKPLVIKYGAFRVTAYTLASGTLVYFPFGLYHALSFSYTGVPLGAWASVIYVALGLSVAYYVLTNWLVRRIETTRLAVFLNVQPVIATVVAFFFLGESIGWAFVIGWAVVLTGVIITEL
jgi:drug/metabolite transporter (DMT)-like permease